MDKDMKMTIFAGDTGGFVVRIKKDGEPYQFISGEDTLRWGVAQGLCADHLAFIKTVTSFEEDGSCIFRLEPEDTRNLLGRFVYDIEWIDKDGNVTTLMPDYKLGKFIVVGSVTQ